MPVDRTLYPADWPAIARRIKDAAGWRCQHCGKQCYGRDILMTDRRADRRFILTVHHINHDPADCSDENLVALCAPCHLRADAKYHARNARRTRARKVGQLELPGIEL